jgi:hypothetical protein
MPKFTDKEIKNLKKQGFDDKTIKLLEEQGMISGGETPPTESVTISAAVPKKTRAKKPSAKMAVPQGDEFKSLRAMLATDKELGDLFDIEIEKKVEKLERKVDKVKEVFAKKSIDDRQKEEREAERNERKKQRGPLGHMGHEAGLRVGEAYHEGLGRDAIGGMLSGATNIAGKVIKAVLAPAGRSGKSIKAPHLVPFAGGGAPEEEPGEPRGSKEPSPEGTPVKMMNTEVKLLREIKDIFKKKSQDDLRKERREEEKEERETERGPVSMMGHEGKKDVAKGFKKGLGDDVVGNLISGGLDIGGKVLKTIAGAVLTVPTVVTAIGALIGAAVPAAFLGALKKDTDVNQFNDPKNKRYVDHSKTNTPANAIANVLDKTGGYNKKPAAPKADFDSPEEVKKRKEKWDKLSPEEQAQINKINGVTPNTPTPSAVTGVEEKTGAEGNTELTPLISPGLHTDFSQYDTSPEPAPAGPLASSGSVGIGGLAAGGTGGDFGAAPSPLSSTAMGGKGGLAAGGTGGKFEPSPLGSTAMGGKGGLAAGGAGQHFEPETVESAIAKVIPPARDTSPSTSTTSNAPFNYNTYKEAIGKRESGSKYNKENSLGYLGKYQFGVQALETFGLMKKGAHAISKKMGHVAAGNDPSLWTLKGGKQEFLTSPGVQEDAMKKFTENNKSTLTSKKAITPTSPAPVVAGKLAMSHLIGVGAALTPGAESQKDAYGTSGAKYFNLGAATQGGGASPAPSGGGGAAPASDTAGPQTGASGGASPAMSAPAASPLRSAAPLAKGGASSGGGQPVIVHSSPITHHHHHGKGGGTTVPIPVNPHNPHKPGPGLH